MDDINLCSAPISIIFQITVWCFTRFIQKNTQSFLQRCFFLWFWITKTKESPPSSFKAFWVSFRLYKPNESNQRNLPAAPTFIKRSQVLREILDLQEELPGPEGRSRSAPGSKEVPPKEHRTTWGGGGWRWRDGGGSTENMMGGWEFCWMEFCLDGLFFGLMEILYVNN